MVRDTKAFYKLPCAQKFPQVCETTRTIHDIKWVSTFAHVQERRKKSLILADNLEFSLLSIIPLEKAPPTRQKSGFFYSKTIYKRISKNNIFCTSCAFTTSRVVRSTKVFRYIVLNLFLFSILLLFISVIYMFSKNK